MMVRRTPAEGNRNREAGEENAVHNGLRVAALVRAAGNIESDMRNM